MQHQDKRLHPLFPSQIRSANDHIWQEVYSDHAPILCAVSYTDANGARQEIQLLSWNVLGSDAGNALAEGTNANCGETPEQEKERHQRIANGMIKILKEQKNVSFISLQEATSEFISVLQNALKNDNKWGIAISQAGGNVLFYNKELYIEDMTPVTKANAVLEATPNRFKIVANNNNMSNSSATHNDQYINIYNCHSSYALSIIAHEEAIESLLSNAQPLKEMVVVAGDFNVTCVPNFITATDFNIGTAASPSVFDPEKKQRTNAIDSCFYSDGHGSKQADIQQLNPVTGKLYTQAELMEPLADNSAKKLVNQLRMGIHIGCDDAKMPTINGQTLKAYEASLQSLLAKNIVYLLPANTDITKHALKRNSIYIMEEQGKYYVYSTNGKGMLSNNRKEINTSLNALKFPTPEQGEILINITDRSLLNTIKSLVPKWQPSIISVRMAVNMLNQRGVAINVPKEVYEFFEKLNNGKEDNIFKNKFHFSRASAETGSTESVYQIICDNQDANLFPQAIEVYLKHLIELENSNFHEYLSKYKKGKRDLSYKRLQGIDFSRGEKLEDYTRLIQLEMKAIGGGRKGEKSELKQHLSEYLESIYQNINDNISDKEKLVIKLLEFVAEREMSTFAGIYDTTPIIEFTGKLAHDLYFAKNKNDYDRIKESIEQSDYKNMKRSKKEFQDLIEQVLVYITSLIKIDNSIDLHNVNCYEYLKNIADKMQESNQLLTALSKYDCCVNLYNHFFNHDGSKRFYHLKTSYAELYTKFLGDLQKIIANIAIDATQGKDDNRKMMLRSFIKSIYENNNKALQRSNDYANQLLGKASKVSKHASGKIKEATKKDMTLLGVSPRQQENTLIRLKGLISSNYQPQLSTNISSTRVYEFHHNNTAVTWEELRHGTQAERVEKKSRINPLYEAYADIKKFEAKADEIEVVYFNSLGYDRSDMEGAIERGFSLELHDKLEQYPHIVVISMPSDKGMMDHRMTHADGSIIRDELADRIKDIILRTTPKIHEKDPYDFYMSDRAKKLVYGSDVEERVIDNCFRNTLKTLKLDHKAQFSQAECSAIYFHFIKFEMTKYIIEKLKPKKINFSCKDAIDRGGVASLYFNLIFSIENPSQNKKSPCMTQEEFLTALHGAPMMVKGRGMNHHMETLLNAITIYVDAQIQKNDYQKIPDWLFKIKEEYLFEPILSLSSSLSDHIFLSDRVKSVFDTFSIELKKIIDHEDIDASFNVISKIKALIMDTIEKNNNITLTGSSDKDTLATTLDQMNQTCDQLLESRKIENDFVNRNVSNHSVFLHLSDTSHVRRGEIIIDSDLEDEPGQSSLPRRKQNPSQ